MKYRILTEVETIKDPWYGWIEYYTVHVQMHKWYGWIDIRKPIVSEDRVYAENCAQEVIDYLEREN